ncbi:hypothetical protein E2C01_041150 [Portunus trituberculatus]|uniref:Uncharacterized protein n=1 Tax=Portunus trituberculatus TaxID=210409 RepID=A0A5B7FPL1_PORTR|nr:hypothetical protein [Portunus trituberculatus]
MTQACYRRDEVFECMSGRVIVCAYVGAYVRVFVHGRRRAANAEGRRCGEASSGVWEPSPWEKGVGGRERGTSVYAGAKAKASSVLRQAFSLRPTSEATTVTTTWPRRRLSREKVAPAVAAAAAHLQPAGGGACSLSRYIYPCGPGNSVIQALSTL